MDVNDFPIEDQRALKNAIITAMAYPEFKSGPYSENWAVEIAYIWIKNELGIDSIAYQLKDSRGYKASVIRAYNLRHTLGKKETENEN